MPQSKAAEEPQFAAFIALDWADRVHAWALQVAGSTQRETGRLEHTPEAIAAWAQQWAVRFAGRPVAVALEQSRGSLVYALSQYQHLVLYPIHPKTSYDYRRAVFPSGSKDDPRDADALLDLLTRHRDRLRALQPDDEPTRKLQILVEKRRQLVDQRTAQTNRITEQLKLYFPQVLNWFDELATPIVAAFLQHWPTLPDLQKASPQQLRAFFQQHGSRSADRIQQRLQEIAQAKPLLQDAAVIEPAVLLVGVLLAQVAALNAGIRAFEKAIEAVAKAHPDYFIFASFPGAGATMAPRLLAAFGSQRQRYRTANELQSFSGIAPVRDASGAHERPYFRRCCPKFLRQSFQEYAALSLQQCDWARAFYQKQKDHGKSHHAAVRALAYKWLRILFRCWQSKKSYQEEVIIEARKAKPAPLRHRSEKAADDRSGGRPVAPCGKPVNAGLIKIGDLLKFLLAQA